MKVGGKGIVGYVAAEGKSRLANDVRIDPDYYYTPDREDVRSEFAVPVRFRDTVFGVVDVQSTRIAAFNQKHY